MPTKTLTEPSADAQLERLYNTGMAAVEQVDLVTGTKYALCLLRLAGAVTPADYPAIKTAIEGATGVQEIILLIDHETRASVPIGKKLMLVAEMNLRVEDDV